MLRRLEVHVRGLTRPKFDFFVRRLRFMAERYGVRIYSIKYRYGVLTIDYSTPRGVNSAFLPVLFNILTGIGVQTLNYSVNRALNQKLEQMGEEQAFLALLAALGVILLIGVFILMLTGKLKEK